jgi:hypothetical protein
MLDRLADNMTFGALLPCPECKTGQFVFRLVATEFGQGPILRLFN